MNTKACGILFCYNEEHIIAQCLEHYLSQGIDLLVIDNMSTDSTPRIIREAQSKDGMRSGKIIDLLSIGTQGYEWRKILRFACDYMHQHLSHYEWVLLIDADSFYVSPVKDMPLLEFMDHTKKYGYNIINGALYDFRPTPQDDPKIISHMGRMQYFLGQNADYVKKKFFYQLSIDCPQHKIFLYHPSINFHASAGHTCIRKNPRASVVKFIYKHYPWVSYEQGLKKIFNDRKPRFVERRLGSGEHPQYAGLLPVKDDLVRESKEFQLYIENQVLIPRFKFFLIMKMRGLAEVLIESRIHWYRFKEVIFQHFEMFQYLFYYRSLRSVAGYFKWAFLDLVPRLHSFVRQLLVKKWSDLQALETKSDVFRPFRVASFSEVISQTGYMWGLPKYYHFLLTQRSHTDDAFSSGMTLEKFKTILSNIPVCKGNVFYFSGGDASLFCKDFLPILRHARSLHPEVTISLKTDGLLIKEHAKELSEMNISPIEITLQAMNDSQDIFEGLRLLNKHWQQQYSDAGQRPYATFCPVVSQANINGIPDLVRKANELKVRKIHVSFARYRTPSAEESLFFNQKAYDSIILQSQRIAKSFKIEFSHDPLFSRPFKPQPCLQPWTTMVIDGEGDIAPCTGGEVTFHKKIKTGQYHFGNLLEEHLSSCWHSDAYLMIRRTCSRFYKEKLIPECQSCHNDICLKGPRQISGHIIKGED